MRLFSGSNRKEQPFFWPPVDPNWARTPRGHFYNFNLLDTEKTGLDGYGGVFVIWHGGFRPRWVFVGHSTDVGPSLERLGENKEIAQYHPHGGLLVTWSPIKDEFRDGVLKYLTLVMNPLIANPGVSADDGVEMVPVTVPGAAAEGKRTYDHLEA